MSLGVTVIPPPSYISSLLELNKLVARSSAKISSLEFWAPEDVRFQRGVKGGDQGNGSINTPSNLRS